MKKRSLNECQAKNSAKPLTMLLFVGIVGGCFYWESRCDDAMIIKQR